ncbi:MAG TPA: PD-(D/E)XK nuclease family protein [Thermoplasmata archaeon]|nr:PD-(D/E)XK nuclease family protein [Thermoplasmata archaeon]
MNPLVPLGLLAAGIAVGALAIRALLLRGRERRWGDLVAVDAGAPLDLAAPRYRLAGRPDAVRRRPDGTLVPVERKSRGVPRGGPYRSHLVQLWAYCLLLEETTGRSPPYGILRYRDADLRVPWTAAARAELLGVRRAVAAPYDGRATPSAARCAGCRWAPRCDVRAAPRG